MNWSQCSLSGRYWLQDIGGEKGQQSEPFLSGSVTDMRGAGNTAKKKASTDQKPFRWHRPTFRTLRPIRRAGGRSACLLLQLSNWDSQLPSGPAIQTDNLFAVVHEGERLLLLCMRASLLKEPIGVRGGRSHLPLLPAGHRRRRVIVLHHKRIQHVEQWQTGEGVKKRCYCSLWWSNLCKVL